MKSIVKKGISTILVISMILCGFFTNSNRISASVSSWKYGEVISADVIYNYTYIDDWEIEDMLSHASFKAKFDMIDSGKPRTAYPVDYRMYYGCGSVKNADSAYISRSDSIYYSNVTFCVMSDSQFKANVTVRFVM